MIDTLLRLDREVALPIRIRRLRADVDAWLDLYQRHDGRLPSVGDHVGLVHDFSTLKSDTFDVDRVDPLIRSFYENLTGFHMEAKVRWKQPYLGTIYGLFAGFVMQLAPGENTSGYIPLSSKIAFLDLGADAPAGARLWERKRVRPAGPFYTGVFRSCHHAHQGQTRSYFQVLLPMWFGNFAVVFELENGPRGGMVLNATREAHLGRNAGNWLVGVLGGRACALRPPGAAGEKIELSVERGPGYEYVVAKQTGFGLGGKVFEIRYRMKRKEQVHSPR